MYKPEFRYSAGIIKNLGIISGVDYLLKSRLVPVAWKRRVEERAKVESIHFTLGMDDNPLSLEQVLKIVDQNPTRDEYAQSVGAKAGLAVQVDHIQEVVNVFVAYGYIEGLIKRRIEDSLIDEKMLLNIHALVCEKTIPLDQVGVLRKVKIVVKNDTTGEVVYVPPMPMEIAYQLEDLFSWLVSPQARDMMPTIKAGIAFLELSRIYPVALGNGRTLRVFARLIMELSGFASLRLLPFERQLVARRAEYYRTLLTAIKNRDLSVWLEFFCQVMADECELLFEDLDKSDMGPKSVPHAVAMSERQIKIMEHLRLKGFVSLSEMREVAVGVSDDSILRDLKDLISKGLVKKKGKTKAAKYGLKSAVW